jgi:hypothetical protein
MYDSLIHLAGAVLSRNQKTCVIQKKTFIFVKMTLIRIRCLKSKNTFFVPAYMTNYYDT